MTSCFTSTYLGGGWRSSGNSSSDQVEADYTLYLDDDLILEPNLIERLVLTLREEGCGFVGSAVIGLSFLDDERPHEQSLELWEGPVRPERITPGSPEWERYRLHNAANLWHIQKKLGLSAADRARYHIAWCGGCCLYDTAK